VAFRFPGIAYPRAGRAERLDVGQAEGLGGKSGGRVFAVEVRFLGIRPVV